MSMPTGYRVLDSCANCVFHRDHEGLLLCVVMDCSRIPKYEPHLFRYLTEHRVEPNCVCDLFKKESTYTPTGGTNQ